MEDFEKRIYSRIPYSGPIFFATRVQLIEGVLKNFSRHGLFIKTPEILPIGELITVTLPYVDDDQGKVLGQILWQNREGYGVELVKKRNGTCIKLRKIEARSRLMNKSL